MTKTYIGIDIGGTNIKVGLFDSPISLLSKASVPTQADMGPAVVVERIANAAMDLLTQAKLGTEQIEAIGIGTPGPADYPNGVLFRLANMPKFENTPLRDMISAKLGNRPAVLENDANVACWGEFAMGAGKEIEDMVFFTLGTGIGGGIVSRGELITGADYNAAELGHVILYPDGRLCGCGQKGCVEAYASANSTAARANEALQNGEKSSLYQPFTKNGEVTSKEVFDHAANGDAVAIDIVEGTAKTLAILCVNMLHTTEPARIVFSGGMIAAGDALLSRIKRYFNEYVWTIKSETIEICFATLGEDTGIIGAASLAKHMLSENH